MAGACEMCESRSLKGRVVLTAGGVALHAAGIGGGFAPGPLARRRRQAPFRPGRSYFDDVPASAQFLDRGIAQPALGNQHARTRRTRPERAREMLRMPGWRIDRLLQIVAGMD